MLTVIAILASSIASVSAQGGENWEFNYAKLGSDWPSLLPIKGSEVNNCGGSVQSPINLMQPIGSYGWAYGETVPKVHDNSSKTFKDLKKLSSITWEDHSIGMNFHESDKEDNSFKSSLAKKFYNSASDTFMTTKFKFKSESEHTVNGKHYDLEMQIFFEASEKNTTSTVNHAAVAILFSVEDFDTKVTEGQKRDINAFFDDLKFEGKDNRKNEVDVTTKIRFATFMNDVIDFSDRWIYEGSFTEPPCNPGVYWNVVRTIYPVENDMFESIKQKMAQLSAEADSENYKYDESDFGVTDEEDRKIRTSPLRMYRKLQKVNDQDIRYMSANFLARISALVTGLSSIFVIWVSA